ncbi:MAG: SEL1-like repeat protein, partial [Bacteroidia bacterium]|nr:SEL1-like repeat protein [Bacteroidia bacterium]
TPLYKSRMDELPAQQQAITHTITMHWDAMAVKDIAREIRMESNAVSAQLKQLEKNGIVEKETTSIKNYLYRISERFFNIWYLMRHCRKNDRNRVKWLVRFLETWCSNDDLVQRTIKHIHALKQGRLYEKCAYYMTEALAQTPISYELQHKLIEEARSSASLQKSELARYLHDSDYQISLEIAKLIQNNEIDNAIALANNVCIPDKYWALGDLFKMKKEIDKAEKYYLMACEKGIPEAMNNLAILYQTEHKDIEKAEKYYLMAIQNGNIDAMNNLAILYQTEHKDFEKAEKYYLMAIQNGYTGAMNNLALFYEDEYKDIEKAEKYYLMAIQNGHTGAMYNLALLYQTENKDIPKAEKYYLLAIQNGVNQAMNNLAVLYKNEYKDMEKAEKYYLLAIQNGHTVAMCNLALLYFQKKQEPLKAMELAKKGFEAFRNFQSAYTLSLIYLWNNEIDQALQVANYFMENQEVYDSDIELIELFIIMLLAKRQYNYAYNIFRANKFNIRDRLKPLYYALMFFMQDKYPDEYRKMGSELAETVGEIIAKIKEWEAEYGTI